MNRSIVLILLLLASAGQLLSQSQPDPIVAAANAIPLRLMWQGPAGYGYGFGSIGDISGDSIPDFVVGGLINGTVWNVYYGGRPKPADTPVTVIQFSSATNSAVLAGNFWGTGHTAIGISQERYWDSPPKFVVYLYRTDSGHVESRQYQLQTDEYLNSVSMTSADLDGDGSDELIITGNSGGTNLEKIYIYKGGPDFLQPTAKVLKLTDSTLPNEGDRADLLQVTDINSDGKPDLLIGLAKNQLGFDRHFLQIFLGSPGSPWNWTSRPDRLYEMDGIANIGAPQAALDANGDGRLDLARLMVAGPGSGIYLFLTPTLLPPTGSDWLMLKNASQSFPKAQDAINGGYFNDSLRQYDMLFISELIRGFSGAPGGIDTKYETYFNDHVINPSQPHNDFNGDHWDDILNGNQIYAGGRYIPADFYRSGVQDVAVTGEAAGSLEVWPVPMQDVLHIQWKQEMRRRPGRFQVHDLSGKLVAEGRIDPGVGGAVWRCSPGIAAGVYVLSACDQAGVALGSKKIVKQK